MLDILPQILVNGLIAGALYSLIALGLSLTYGILQFINFAHADLAIVGAYMFFFGEKAMKWPLTINFLFAIIVVGILGIVIEHLTFKPIRRAPAVAPMLASIGVQITLQSLILIFFGSAIESFDHSIVKSYSFFGDKIAITNTQIFAILSSLILMLLLFAYLKFTQTGKAIRAVADNLEVSSILGIRPNRIIKIIVFIGSILAGFAGIFIGYDYNLHPTMGIPLIIKAFAAVIIGGLGNIPGAIIGGFTIGILENLAIGLTPLPASYKDAIAFILLILILFLRPQGILGQATESKKIV